MKPKFGLVLAVWTLLLGLAAIPGSQVSAQGQAQQTAAQRCFERHQFGVQPVDVAKTADGQTVLAQTSWNWHDTIGCYLTLDDDALAALRAAPPPQDLPAAPTDASRRCFEHHKFGENPVDVAKTADGQTVLARLSWGYHSTFGCYLVLDDTALTTLRATAQPDPTPITDETNSDDSDTDDVPIDTGTPLTDPQFTTIAAGSSHSCAVRVDQTIACWGDDRSGQIDVPPGLYAAIAVSSSHSCAIRTDQTITCWGYNRFGQTDAPPGQFTAIATYYPYSCAIRVDQTITCWGDSRSGVANVPDGQYTAITTGQSHSCAIRVDQTITCWGDSRSGVANVPDGQYTAITTGGGHSCAIRTDQTITCWGDNQDGETDAPDGQYTAIATGAAHSCAIRTDQTITCWGDNQDGETDAPDGQYSAIATGNDYSCAIRNDQTFTCWGDNQYGQTSVPISLRTPPEELLSVEVFSASEPPIKTGHSFEVAVEFSRAVSGFDANDLKVVNGDVTRFSGSGSKFEATVAAASLGTVVVLIPRAVAQDQNGRRNEPSQPFARTVREDAFTFTATVVASSGPFSCALRIDESIACWGSNQDGQTDAPDGQYTAIATGGAHSCAIRTDQTITCWGSNGSNAIDVPPGRFAAISANYYYSCAVRTDQTIICWGNNRVGQTDAPDGQYTAIATGWAHSCAIRNDQTITCWGYNEDGQTDAPDGQYTAIATGVRNSCAIRTDQTIACWGSEWAYAPDGQYTAITTGGGHSCAIRTDQTIACWRTSVGPLTAPPFQFTVITPTGYRFGSQPCGIRVDQTVVCWTHDESGQPNASPGQFVAVTLDKDDKFFDTWDRDAIRASAFTEFNRKEPDHGWTGDIDNCVAGTTSQPYRDSIFQRVNWYRQMAGLNPVVENLEFSDFAQHAALIMAAEGGLSHFPGGDWACYTQSGYVGASHSNLYLGRAGISSIDGYIRDPGVNNLRVGHRRDILSPDVGEFGTGDIPPGRSNGLYTTRWSRASEIREERGFVAWPPPGYVPPAVNWGRWSFSLSDAHYPADFSTASVEVSDEFGTLAIEVIHRDSTGIVWGMHGNADDGLVIGRRPLYSVAESNYCYTVTIGGVKINDSVQTPYEYAVCVLTR